MQRIILVFALFITSFSGFAQNDAYHSTMAGLLTKMKSASSIEMYTPIANGFERVANAEPKQWLPKYYAAFCYVMQSMMNSNKDQIDPVIDQAEKLLTDAAALVKNDEILCLQAFCKSARIGVNPMARGMKYGMESSKLLESAKALNPENPRIYLLQGQSAFYTPEAFGGGKAKAKPIFEQAVAKYAAFKPTDDLSPNWGADEANRMLEVCNK
jgi:hypothetical protein